VPNYVDGIYVDGALKQIAASKLTASPKIDGVAFDGDTNIIHYAVCNTEAEERDKSLSVTGFALNAGAVVHIQFVNGNTTSNPRLNIGGTGLKNFVSANNNSIGPLREGATLTVVYDGSKYIAIEAPQQAGYNDNILDNWYFGGGGSQLGYGTFPINQRRAASGTGELNNLTNFIDRWKTQAIWRLDTDGLYLETQEGSDQSAGLRQDMEQGRIPPGMRTVCLSVLLTDNTLWSRSGTISETNAWQLISGSTNTNGCAIRYYNYKWEVGIWNNDTNRKIVAAKLEFGTQQTLAHLEGSTWVLNGLPNFNVELDKCRRYLQVYFRDSSYGNSKMFAPAFSVVSYGGVARFQVALTPSMRATPAQITDYSALGIRTPTDASNIEGVTWSTAARNESLYTFEAASSNFTTGGIYWCTTLVLDQLLIFSAEL
jgi:hypothetical protein